MMEKIGKKMVFSLALLGFLYVPVVFSTEKVYAQEETTCPSNDRGGQLRLPFEGAWGISQGYGGTFSHQAGGRDQFALDFNLAGNSDAHQPVYAPGKGKIVSNVLADNEIICFDLEGDGLGSVEIGHLEPSSKSQIGNELDRGEELGTLIGGPTAHSSGPHIHIAYFNGPNCRGLSVPFNDMFGEGLSFPDQAGINDWAGSLVGCGQVPEPSESTAPEPPGAIDTILNWIGFGNEPPPPPPAADPNIGNVGPSGYQSPHYGTVDTEPMSLDGFVTLVVVKIEQFGPQSFTQLAYNIIDLVVYGAITFLVLVIVYSGFLFVTSGGNDAKVTRARSSLRNIVKGAAILIVAVALKAAIMVLQAQGIINV